MSNTQVNQLVKANNWMRLKQLSTNRVDNLVNNALGFLHTPTKAATKRKVVQNAYGVKEVEFGPLDVLAVFDKLNKPASVKSTNPISSGLGW